MNDVVFICRCHPYDYFYVTPDLNKAVAWAKRNKSSAGELQIKRVRWNMLKDSKVVQFKPKEIDVMEDVAYLKLATGGKEPPADGNWISQLDVGTIFLVQRKNAGAEFALGRFVLVGKTSKTVIVMAPNNPQIQDCWNPVRFCRQFDLYEILGIIEDGPAPEVKDGEDHRDEHPTGETT